MYFEGAPIPDKVVDSRFSWWRVMQLLYKLPEFVAATIAVVIVGWLKKLTVPYGL